MTPETCRKEGPWSLIPTDRRTITPSFVLRCVALWCPVLGMRTVMGMGNIYAVSRSVTCVKGGA